MEIAIGLYMACISAMLMLWRGYSFGAALLVGATAGLLTTCAVAAIIFEYSGVIYNGIIGF